MVEFPLMKLPILAQKLVIQRIEPADIIELITVSQKLRNIVRIFKLPCKKLIWKNLENSSEIELDFSDLSDDFIPKKFEIIVKPGQKPMKIRGNGKIELRVLHFIKTKMDALEEYSKFFKEILNIQKYEVYATHFENFFNCFIWKFPETFHKMSITPSRNQFFTSEEVRFLLEDVASEYLVMYANYAVRNQKLAPIPDSSIVKHHEMIIYSDFLEFDYFLKMESKIVEAYQETVKLLDLKKFLQIWVDSEGLQNLEMFSLILGRFHQGLSYDRVLEGVDHFEWLPETRPAISQSNVNNREKLDLTSWKDDGRDFRRKSDGQLATLMLDSDRFHFIVWHDKFLIPPVDA